jgi:predicted ATPase
VQENLEHLTKTHKKTSQLQNGSTQTWKIKTRDMKEKEEKKKILLLLFRARRGKEVEEEDYC